MNRNPQDECPGEKYESGDECPACEKSILALDEGHEATRDEPAADPVLYCTGCGHTVESDEVDWDAMAPNEPDEAPADDAEPDKPAHIISSLEQFLPWRGFGSTECAYWARMFYKCTGCGPWTVFVMKDKDAHTNHYPEQLAEITKVDGLAQLMNADKLLPDFVQFLGFDAQGLSRKDREWDMYVGLVYKFIADEPKMDRTGRLLEVTHCDDSSMHIKLSANTQVVAATYKEIYYEDIGKPVYENKVQPCSCITEENPEPDHKCQHCNGDGTVETRVPTDEKVTVDPEQCAGIKFGSIIEGSEANSGPFTHLFPFDAADFDKDVAHMEAETSFYWERDNGTWYLIQTADTNYMVVNVWGDLKWQGGVPPEELKKAAEAAIAADWQDVKGHKGCIEQTIPTMPSSYSQQSKVEPPQDLGVGGATIYTFENDSTFD